MNHSTGIRSENVGQQFMALRHCDGCGDMLPPEPRTVQPITPLGHIRFCAACMRTAPLEEIEIRRREIALRGVPLS